MRRLRRVIVETPFRGKTHDEQARNIAYARACAQDCLLKHNEAPFLSHLLYTQPGILDDDNAAERQRGISAGFAWGEVAAATIVYTDFGISPGMQMGIDEAKELEHPIEYRTLPNFHWPVVPYAI